MPRSITIGKNRGKKINLSPTDLSTHLHVLGASGKGKSKELEYIIRQHIINRHGLCLIDPHGNLYDDVVRWCAHEDLHRDRTIHLINPNLRDWTVGFHPLRLEQDIDPVLRVDAAVNACAQVWGGEDTNKTPLLKKCLTAIFYTLALRGLTLTEAIELASATDPYSLRKYLTDGIDDPLFRSVWDDLNGLNRREFTEVFSSTNNRLVEFLKAPTIRNMLGIGEQAIDFKQCMDNDEIVLVNLAPGKTVSRDNARLLGTLITNDLFSLACTRDIATAEEHPFYLVIDECYDFLSDDIESMLDQTRKFGLHVTLSHQRLGQLRKAGDHIYNGVMAGAQTKLVFGGLEDDDAEIMARQMFRAEFDLDQPKDILTRPTTVAYEIDWLYGEADGEADTWSDTVFDTAAAIGNAGVSQTFDADGNPVGTTQIATEGDVLGSGTGRTRGGARTHTETRHQTLRPVLEDRPTAVKDFNEVVHDAIVRLRELPRQNAILKPIGRKSRRVWIPDVKKARASDETVEAFTRQALTDSTYAIPTNEVVTRIAARHDDLVLKAEAWEFTDEPAKVTAEDNDKEDDDFFA